MPIQDNYVLQLQQAQRTFLNYDQDALLKKLHMRADEQYFYPVLFSQEYRLSRTTGDLQRRRENRWVSANTHGEVMTLLDLICDSSPDRHSAGRWKSMASFGLQFHQNLLEDPRDPWAEEFQARQERFHQACQALGGRPLPKGDISYALPVFEDLELAVQLWLEDEEFPASLRLFWDENALQYLKYETMYFAKNHLLQLLKERMG